MKTLLVVLLLTCFAFADAGPKCKKPTHDPVPPVHTPRPVATPLPPNSTNVTSNASTTSAANSSATSTSNATGGNSSSTATNGGNMIEQSYNTPRQAPPAYAPTVFAGSCQGSFSGGASAPVGGVSFGGTKADKVCQGINLSQVFISQGNYTAAAKVLCSLKPAKDAGLTMDDCMAFVRPVPVAPAPSVAPVSPVQVIVEPAVTPAPVTERVILPAATVKKAVKRHQRPCPTLEK